MTSSTKPEVHRITLSIEDKPGHSQHAQNMW